MKISKQSDNYNLLVSRHELAVISNCLNETLQSMDDDEFHTRVGIQASNARDLLKQILGAYDEA